MVAGCRECETDAQPYVEYLDDFGIYVNKCKYKKDINITAEDEPCGAGKVTVLEGVTEALEELQCRDCSDLIPNCLACNSHSGCTLCKTGYKAASLKDAEGVEHGLCLFNFCGLSGAGDGCDPNVEIDNCLRSQEVFIGVNYYDDCITCEAGYYSHTYTVLDDEGVRDEEGQVRRCLRKYHHFSMFPNLFFLS